MKGSVREKDCLNLEKSFHRLHYALSFPSGAHWVCSFLQQPENAVICKMFLPRKAHLEIQHPRFYIGGCSHRHCLPCIYRNSRFTEGKQVFGIDDIVNTNSRHREPPYQSGNRGKPSSQMLAKGQPCTRTLLKVAALVLLH